MDKGKPMRFQHGTHTHTHGNFKQPWNTENIRNIFFTKEKRSS